MTTQTWLPTDTEKEVIFLKAINELIDSMVNNEIFVILGDNPHCEVRFKSTTHQKYFNIILSDFLSRSDKKVLGEQQSYLSAAKEICQSPNFDKNNSIKNLDISVQEFVDWLNHEIQVKIWLP